MKAMIDRTQTKPTTNAATGGPNDSSGVASEGFEVKGTVATSPKSAAPL